jgi:hypothetical protein
LYLNSRSVEPPDGFDPAALQYDQSQKLLGPAISLSPINSPKSNRWLDRAGIRVMDLHALRILRGRVTFSIT